MRQVRALSGVVSPFRLLDSQRSRPVCMLVGPRRSLARRLWPYVASFARWAGVPDLAGTSRARRPASNAVSAPSAAPERSVQPRRAIARPMRSIVSRTACGVMPAPTAPAIVRSRAPYRLCRGPQTTSNPRRRRGRAGCRTPPEGRLRPRGRGGEARRASSLVVLRCLFGFSSRPTGRSGRIAASGSGARGPASRPGARPPARASRRRRASAPPVRRIRRPGRRATGRGRPGSPR